MLGAQVAYADLDRHVRIWADLRKPINRSRTTANYDNEKMANDGRRGRRVKFGSQPRARPTG